MPSNVYSFSSEMSESRLPYPTIVRETDDLGRAISEEYIIPDCDRQKVLEMLCPYIEKPKLEERFLDLHENKHFIAKDYKVVREYGRNWLVSPYYYSSGGTIIDWWSEDEDDEPENDSELAEFDLDELNSSDVDVSNN
ncbi:MAG TPA: hypothetical protein VKC60_09585 [Opitutaceae bacterium]|nr:hypothetical protein [Opitutaceae bacterium]